MATDFTRGHLYERVWKDPVRTVAGELGVSDVWLKKVCASAAIPVPDRGYWTKLRAGKKVRPMALPAREPGQSDAVSVGKAEYSYT